MAAVRYLQRGHCTTDSAPPISPNRRHFRGVDMGPLMFLTTLGTVFATVNSAADLGERISGGAQRRQARRAAKRVQPLPRRAAVWLRMALRDAGHNVADVKPGLDQGQWVLLVEYRRPTEMRPPPVFEGYPVRVVPSTKRRHLDLDYAAPTA